MAEEPKSFFLSTELHDYVVAHGTPPDDVLIELAEVTRRETGGMSMMQVAPEQGAFMQLLTCAIGARQAIEVGTFTGYSALCIARGLPEDGHLICCDVSEEWTSIGVPHWEKAGVAGKIDLRIGPALQTLRSLPEEAHLDLAFIDADKPAYVDYYEALLPRMRTGALILVDNVLWMGRVADPVADDENTLAVRRFNRHVADDTRVDSVMLPIADGLTLLRKR